MRKKPQINLFKTKTGQKMVGFSVNHFQIDSVTPLLFLVLAHKFRGTNASSENCSENTFRSLCILWTETVNYCLSNWIIWTSKEVSRNIQNMRLYNNNIEELVTKRTLIVHFLFFSFVILQQKVIDISVVWWILCKNRRGLSFR